MNKFFTYLLYGENPPKPKHPTEPGWFARNRKIIEEKGRQAPPKPVMQYGPKSNAPAH